MTTGFPQRMRNLALNRPGFRLRWSLIPLYRLVFLIATAGALAGCVHVAPYEREYLAERDMQVDPNPVASGYDDHIYFSIEGSSGGRSFGGGGCGCN